MLDLHAWINTVSDFCTWECIQKLSPPFFCICHSEHTVRLFGFRETIQLLPCHHRQNHPRTPFLHWLQWALIGTQQGKHSYMPGTTLMLPPTSSLSHRHIERAIIMVLENGTCVQSKDAIPWQPAMDSWFFLKGEAFCHRENHYPLKLLLLLIYIYLSGFGFGFCSCLLQLFT